MFTRRARLLWLLLVFSEIVLVAIAFELAYLLRVALPGFPLFFLSPGRIAELLFASSLLWAVIGLPLDVYRYRENFSASKTFRRTLAQTFWFALLFAAAIFLFKLGEISRSFV